MIKYHTKDKWLILTAGAVALALLLAGAAHAQEQVGRYQVFMATYQFINIKGEEHRITSMFKLDTATGKLYDCWKRQYRDPKTGNEVQESKCGEWEDRLEFSKQ